MVKTAQDYGPDNSREWDPDSPLLKSPMAPHETAAVLRMQRAGYPGSSIMKTLKLRGTALMNQMQKALNEETRASGHGRDVHDSLIKPS